MWVENYLQKILILFNIVVSLGVPGYTAKSQLNTLAYTNVSTK